jgi:hypothetical protein
MRVAAGNVDDAQFDDHAGAANVFPPFARAHRDHGVRSKQGCSIAQCWRHSQTRFVAISRRRNRSIAIARRVDSRYADTTIVQTFSGASATG